PREFRIGDRGRYPDVNGLIVGFKSMQMNPGSQRHDGSSRASRSSGGHDDSRSRSYRSSHGSGAASSSGWGQRAPASSSMPSSNWKSSTASGSGWDA
ncbi:hypothetical protein GGI22_003335, partial [Coemansia erecta]